MSELNRPLFTLFQYFHLCLCREEDKTILKKCLQSSFKLPEDSNCFKEVAMQLYRGTEEVCYDEVVFVASYWLSSLVLHSRLS